MFIYQADLYCDDCGEKIKASLAANSVEPCEDSDRWPQSYPESQSETDCPNHCATCGEYLDQPLTSNGVAYVIEALRQYVTTPAHKGSKEVLDVWADDLSSYYLDVEEKVTLDIYRELRDNEEGRV